MKIIIAYATYSGGTQLACEFLSKNLVEIGHQVTMKMIKEVSFEDCLNYDLRIFASPSWDYEGKEGQPHEDFIVWMKNNADKKFDGKACAIIGLGDSSFSHFCGAVAIIEEFIKSASGVLKVPSLMIDNYFLNVEENNKIISEWAKKLTI